ncbi:hypothetical protein ACGFX2_31895 [Streptomyces goshikiensis]|uniref:hypothetical protein n=1 Tax=Streptomyces goshikiensis TaxID=1942 RepID=UPI00371DF763
MTGGGGAGLVRPVRAVRVLSPQTVGNCAPTYGRVELDFEPAGEGETASVEFGGAVWKPEPDAGHAAALARGVLAGLGVARARAVVRLVAWHWVDSSDPVFEHLGTLAAREALRCAAQGREPEPIVDRGVRIY